MEVARRNAVVGFPQRDVSMLMGEGNYMTIQAQIQYDLGVIAEITSAALKVWRTIPGTGDLQGQLTKVIQGSNEPNVDFVDRLIQVSSKVFGDPDQAMPLVKQLAYENANKWCKEAIRPWKNKDLSTYIKICRHINDAVVTGQVIAAAMRGVSPLEKKNPGVRSKFCFKCGQPSHFKTECPITKNPQQSRLPARSPRICPKCKRGTHWSSKSRSSTDAFENPLPKNRKKGPVPQGPQMYRTVMEPLSYPIQVVPRHNPFYPSTPSTGEPREAEDWISVPPLTKY